MRILLKTVGFLVVMLFGIALISCSAPPSSNDIKKLILQSSREFSDLEIINIGKYDNESNRSIVTAKYLWTSHSAWREVRVVDFVFFKDIGSGAWKLNLLTTTLSRKRIS